MATANVRREGMCSPVPDGLVEAIAVPAIRGLFKAD
jgi:hypothetical protein